MIIPCTSIIVIIKCECCVLLYAYFTNLSNRKRFYFFFCFHSVRCILLYCFRYKTHARIILTLRVCADVKHNNRYCNVYTIYRFGSYYNNGVYGFPDNSFLYCYSLSTSVHLCVYLSTSHIKYCGIYTPTYVLRKWM